ncbi:hypothetical protein [Segatella bryantii]|uniref:hypothetical protein n=1 Tax=Segatella bryantii TaxID=77095 RepID=UPI00285365FA|nr:hypothetical protein [Segatella bryantii]MDR4932072.1 hypothetical protein [Segatella bryantii]
MVEGWWGIGRQRHCSLRSGQIYWWRSLGAPQVWNHRTAENVQQVVRYISAANP